jgi:5-oxoprolinase (ATP-hydrolysing)
MLVPTKDIQSIRMGTTVATNALLERRGEPFFLVASPGMADLAAIGNQSRPNIFDLEIRRAPGLPVGVGEISARVRVVTEANGGMTAVSASGYTGGEPEAKAEAESKEQQRRAPDAAGTIVVGTTGERVFVEAAVDVAAVTEMLRGVRAGGVKTLAISLLHAYTYPHHENEIARIALEELGFEHVSVSSGTVSMTRAVPRTLTACVDAYLTPVIRRYVNGFLAGFDAGAATDACPVLFMQSDGGLTDAREFTGHKSILSGPAGGVVGYAATAYRPDAAAAALPSSAVYGKIDAELAALGAAQGVPVIGFDMGGTSTDVSRFAGSLEHVFTTTIAGVEVQSPHLDITTVAAGGGSLLEFFAGIFHVGPGSAGAHPGPVCYRREGGKLAVTDANVALGRIAPALFPAIFGPNKDLPLDVDGARAALAAVTKDINAFYSTAAASSSSSSSSRAASGDDQVQQQDGDHKPLTVDEVAFGFLAVANEAMCRPIRQITQAKGLDPAAHRLACFGGAGGQHACAVARALGMREVVVHKYAGILSAVGLGLAETVEELQEALGTCEIAAGGGAAATASSTGSSSAAAPSRTTRKRKASNSVAHADTPTTTAQDGGDGGDGSDGGDGGDGRLGPIARLDRLDRAARDKLTAQLPAGSNAMIRTEQFLLIRYLGTDVPTIVPRPKGTVFFFVLFFLFVFVFFVCLFVCFFFSVIFLNFFFILSPLTHAHTLINHPRRRLSRGVYRAAPVRVWFCARGPRRRCRRCAGACDRLDTARRGIGEPGRRSNDVHASDGCCDIFVLIIIIVILGQHPSTARADADPVGVFQRWTRGHPRVPVVRARWRLLARGPCDGRVRHVDRCRRARVPCDNGSRGHHADPDRWRRWRKR